MNNKNSYREKIFTQLWYKEILASKSHVYNRRMAFVSEFSVENNLLNKYFIFWTKYLKHPKARYIMGQKCLIDLYWRGKLYS